MGFIRLLKWGGITVAALVAALVIASVVVIALGISLDLSFIRATVEDAASVALNRKVTIAGPIRIVPSLWPSLRVQGVRIGNPRNWGPTDLVRIESAGGQLGALPLFRGEIHIKEIVAEDVSLNLEKRGDGSINWEFGAAGVQAGPPSKGRDGDATEVTFVGLDKVLLRRVSVTYRDLELLTSQSFKLAELIQTSEPGKPLNLALKGSAQQQPYSIVLTGSPLSDLFVEDKPWSVKLSGNIADAAVTGKGEVTLRQGERETVLEVVSDNVDVGGLLKWLNIADDIDMRVRRLSLDVAARGRNLPELLGKADLKAKLEDGQWTMSDPNTKASVAVRILKGRLEAPSGEAVVLNLDGRIGAIPVTVNIRGDRLATYMSEAKRLSLAINVDTAGAQLNLNGSVDLPISRNILDLEMSFTGERLDSLNELLLMELPPLGPYSLEGKFSMDEDGYRVSNLAVRVRKSSLNGKLNLVTKGERPLLDADLTAKRLQTRDFNLGDWSAFEAGRGTPPDRPGDAGGPTGMPQEDIEALLDPKTLGGLSARFSLKVGAVLADRKRLGGGSLLVKLNPVEAAQAQGQKIQVSMELISGTADVGEILHQLGVVDGLEVEMKRLRVTASATADKPEKLHSQLKLRATLEGGKWTLHDPNTGASLAIRIPKGVLTAPAGAPVALNLDGLIHEIPIRINIQGDRLTSYLNPAERLSLGMSIKGVGAHLKLRGAAALPITRNELDLKMSLEGDRLDSLNTLLLVDLPPWGPYALGGRLRVNDDGYKVSDLDLRVGESNLVGELSFETKGRQPFLNFGLAAKRLQINDFDFGDWSPFPSSTDNATDEAGTPAISSDVTQEEMEELFAPATMRSLDSHVSVKVREVLSGKDELGSGSLIMKLENGRFSMVPQINIPGGSVEMGLIYKPTETDMAAEVTAHIDHFDYGVLARRIDPQTDVRGTISLDVGLKSRAKNLDSMMRYASGHFDFALWPETIEADIFDLWAVNLFSTVTRSLDKGPESKVNCAFVRLAMTEGVMSEREIQIDTSRMRVSGGGKVDFRTETVDMRFVPSAKKPEFFSLGTPIEVVGRFSDFGVEVGSGGIAGTVIKFVTSPLHVPIRRLFTTPLPEKGEDVCAKRMLQVSPDKE